MSAAAERLPPDTALPRRLSSCMQQRLDLLSNDASELVRVAAVLPDRFSAGLLAAMLERQPASLMSALAEAVRAGLLVDDGEQLRFGHDLLREATRKSLPQSLRRAMERQSASIMLSMGAAPAEVATQLARSADPGDKEAISALRQAAQAVSQSDASAAADLSKRALELMPVRRRRTRAGRRRNRWAAQPSQTLRRVRRTGRRRPVARRRPKRKPRSAFDSRRSPGTPRNGESRKIAERSS